VNARARTCSGCPYWRAARALRGPREIRIRPAKTKRVLENYWRAGFSLERLWGYKEALEWVLRVRKGMFKGCRLPGRRAPVETREPPAQENPREESG
jgi:hypothetical protein